MKFVLITFKIPRYAGPEKYWLTSKKIFLALLFNKNSENIENAAGRFDPGSSSTVRAKLPVELYGFFVHYWPLKHIYIFSGPKHMLDGLLFRPGPGFTIHFITNILVTIFFSKRFPKLFSW